MEGEYQDGEFVEGSTVGDVFVEGQFVGGDVYFGEGGELFFGGADAASGYSYGEGDDALR